MKTGLEAVIATIGRENCDIVGWIVKTPAGDGYVLDLSLADQEGRYTVLVRIRGSAEIKRFPASDVFQLT